MRGKLKNSGANIESVRITPADAGKTFTVLQFITI